MHYLAFLQRFQQLYHLLPLLSRLLHRYHYYFPLANIYNLLPCFNQSLNNLGLSPHTFTSFTFIEFPGSQIFSRLYATVFEKHTGWSFKYSNNWEGINDQWLSARQPLRFLLLVPCPFSASWRTAWRRILRASCRETRSMRGSRRNHTSRLHPWGTSR